MVSRNFTLFRKLFIIAMAFAQLVVVVFEASNAWLYSVSILLIYAYLLNIYCSACPHCGKRFFTGLTFNPFRSNAGYCNQCGNEVKYKELADEDEE